MAGLLGKPLSDFANSSSSKLDIPTEAQQGVFYIRPSPNDASVLLVHASGQSIATEPPYIVKTSKKQLEYYRINNGLESMIGDAKIHQWNSSSAEITLHGKAVKMEISANSGHTKVELPSLGKMKWKLDSHTSSGLILCEDGGQKIAKYGSAGSKSGFGVKKLEILVPVDAIGVEEIIFAAVAAKGVNKAANEAAFKVLKAFVF